MTGRRNKQKQQHQRMVHVWGWGGVGREGRAVSAALRRGPPTTALNQLHPESD